MVTNYKFLNAKIVDNDISTKIYCYKLSIYLKICRTSKIIY